MSIVDSLKKLAVKLGRAKTPEEIYAPDITTALKQVAVGYGVADDPTKVPGSSIDDVIDLLANKIEPGGGGNPNRVQIITGTLANPWGDVGLQTLAEASPLAVSVSLDIVGESIPIQFEVFDGLSVAIATVGTLDKPGFKAHTIQQLIWASGTTESIFPKGFSCRAYNSETGETVDMTQEYASFASQVKIIWHPLPVES